MLILLVERFWKFEHDGFTFKVFLVLDKTTTNEPSLKKELAM